MTLDYQQVKVGQQYYSLMSQSTYDRALAIYEGGAIQLESSVTAINLIVDSMDRSTMDEDQYLAIKDWQKQLENAQLKTRGLK